ncbi:hypothetical protein D9758_016379 [Tetrapyrgos nigripes]|uniref:Uncharacterized protein n=1 Tax=Tetrapyrgos nigripes TaxID=182062 RepID=A0A8H5C7X7_9AGAR|nr:hypothetical protein D9758_016379 [Tetrapyrgos nigripes]
MVAHERISDDLKLAAICLYENGLLDLDDVLACVGFSRRTFFCALCLWQHEGIVSKHKSYHVGHPCTLNMEDHQYLLMLVNHNPEWFLDELHDLMDENQHIAVHFTTIHRKLKHAGISVKDLQIIAQEWNPDCQADYCSTVARFQPKQLIFLGEMSKDKQTMQRRKGQARKGVRACWQGVRSGLYFESADWAALAG